MKHFCYEGAAACLIGTHMRTTKAKGETRGAISFTAT
jgi:hypothetical protein